MVFLPQNLRVTSKKIGSNKVCHFNYFCFWVFVVVVVVFGGFFFSFLLKLCYKGVKSKRPTQCEEEQSEQLSESEGEESEPRIERKFTDDILSLQAEVKKLRRIVNKRNRKQRKSEKLFKKMTEEWEEMKPQFQDILITVEGKYQLAKIIGIRTPCF